MCLIDFWNFLTIHVFGVEESIADISTELPSLGHVTSCYFMSRNSRKLRKSRKSRHVTSCHVISRHVMSCHVMPRNFTSYPVMPRHVTSCHAITRHVMSRHVTSCHITSCPVMARHGTSWHIMARHGTHGTSWHVMSRRKSRDGHTTNASLLTDFFHTQIIQIRHNRVRWLPRRVPIPYCISGI